MNRLLTVATAFIIAVGSIWASGPSNTLPVIYINIDNNAEVTSKETYLNAKYWLDPNGTEGIEAIGSQESPLALKIKGRGNYTFVGFDKKPYRLKLDKKAALCGMKKSKHFGLLAHADDNQGFLRNRLGFKVSRMVGLPWTPADYPVELVVNGTYRGLYFLTELIRIDPDRVNVSAWTEEDETGAPLEKWIEGGTLVELDNYEEPAQISFQNEGAPEPLRFTYDKSVDPGFEPEGYVNWLKGSLGAVNNLIENGSPESDELWNLVDIDDLARFIVVQEFMDNYESFHGSCYMFREKGDESKWHFSPVWDFGSSFQRTHPSHPFHLVGSGNPHYNHWVGKLYEYPALREKIKQYWLEVRSHRSELDQYASDFINSIKAAAACDKEKWPQYGNDNLDSKWQGVKSMLDASQKFLNQEFMQGEKEIYLVGGFNGWTLADASYLFDNVASNAYSLKVKNGINDSWKINDGTWGKEYDFGASSNQPSLEEPYILTRQGGNITTAIPAGYWVHLNLAGSNPVLKISSSSSAVEEIITYPETGLKVSVQHGMVSVVASAQTEVVVSDITGRCRTYNLHAGYNTLELGKGLWIVAGKKVVL